MQINAPNVYVQWVYDSLCSLENNKTITIFWSAIIHIRIVTKTQQLCLLHTSSIIQNKVIHFFCLRWQQIDNIDWLQTQTKRHFFFFIQKSWMFHCLPCWFALCVLLRCESWTCRMKNVCERQCCTLWCKYLSSSVVAKLLIWNEWKRWNPKSLLNFSSAVCIYVQYEVLMQGGHLLR